MLKERNVDGISALYDKYAPAIYGAIKNEVNDTKIAETILEQTFLNIWNNSGLEPRCKNYLLLWLLKTAKTITTQVLAEIEIRNVVKQNKFMPANLTKQIPPVAFGIRPAPEV